MQGDPQNQSEVFDFSNCTFHQLYPFILEVERAIE